jgi:hypothetical protein
VRAGGGDTGCAAKEESKGMRPVSYQHSPIKKGPSQMVFFAQTNERMDSRPPRNIGMFEK